MGKNGKKRILKVSIIIISIICLYGLLLANQETSVQKRAEAALKARNYAEVEKLGETYLKEHPEDTEVAFILAQAEAFSGKYEEAIKVIDQILNLVPDHHDALLLKARILIWKGQVSAARQILEATLEKNPMDIEALLELGRVEELSGQLHQAEELYLQVIGQNPSSESEAAAWFRLSKIYQQSGNWEKAEQCLEKAVKLDPNNKDYLNELNSFKKISSKESATGGKRAEIWVQYRSDNYSDQPNSFSSERVLFLYRPSSVLTLIPKLGHSRYFNRTDYLFGLEAYPRLWKGAYAYLDLNYSTPANSLPRTSWLLEIYQHLYDGLEGSLGYWRMHFRTTNVSVYLGSLGYYFKDYYFSLRGYYTPEETGKNFSWVVQGRKYFGPENYFYLSFGSGSRPFEITNLGDLIFIKSLLFGGGFNFYFMTHWKLEGHFSLIKEKDDPHRTTVSLTGGYRF